MRAQIRAGELLREMEKAKPRSSNQHKDRSRVVTDPPKLSDLGVSKTQSSRWQQLAALPKDEQEEKIEALPPYRTTLYILARLRRGSGSGPFGFPYNAPHRNARHHDKTTAFLNGS